MEDLIKALEKTVSNSQIDQNQAVSYIQDYTQRDYTGFLKTLSDILFNPQNPPVVRAAAGLQLKNQLTARDDTLRQQQQDRWRSLPDQVRQYIKERVFNTLGTEIFRPSSAPQCVAYIAIAELTEKQWPGFIDALVQNIKNSNSTDKLRLATLEAIGYVCQEIISSEHQNNRKREITNGLNASMTSIYSYIGDCISSKNYELMTTSLQCLTGLLTWAQFNQSLIRFLCQLLRNCGPQLGQMPHSFDDEQRIAIMCTTCDCLNVCLERKHSKVDSIDVRTSLFEDEVNLRSIITTLDEINRLPMQQSSQAFSELARKLSQVITNIMRYVYIGPPEKPQNLQDMYSIMKVIIAHPSITVSIEAVRFWNRVFSVAPKKPNPTLTDDITTSLLIICANKLIKAHYDCQLYGYEFDCQQEFDNFQGRYRNEVCELCRNLTQQNDRICFELVCNSIAKSIQQRNTNLNEWDALSSLASAVCAKLKDPSVYVLNSVELVKALMMSMDNALAQAASIPSSASGPEASLIPDLISSQLSSVSALYVFLPHWHQNDKELTKELLKKIILFAFHRPDKFIASSMHLVGNNTSLLNNEAFLKGFRLLSRHASASFVRVCLNHSRHLLDIFSYLKSIIDCLFATTVDNPYSSEKCQLYEGLTLICNEESDELVRKKFVLELFESIKWFNDYELNCDQFIEFVGLNRLEVDIEGSTPQKMMSRPISATQMNRVKLSYVITFLGSLTKRLSSRNTLLPEILVFAKPILNIIFTMHALWLPEMKAKCVKEYQQVLFAPFNKAYKQQILDTILVNQQKLSPSPDGTMFNDLTNTADTTNRPAQGNEQYIELFSWNFYESLLATMGAIITKTSPEFYSFINAVQLQTALTGAEYLPSLKMHKLIKHFIMPLVNTCGKDQHLIETQLLPLLSKLLPFLFDMLDGQWKAVSKEDDVAINGFGDGKVDQNQLLADEMVQDQLLRNLSRDFIDLMNLILIETVQNAEPTQPNNNNSAIGYNRPSNNITNTQQNSARPNQQQDLYTVGKLGLNLLAAGPDFILKVMASTLRWSDSTLNAKTIFINQLLIKHIISSNLIKSHDEASLWLGCMFSSVITSLRMFGEHEQNCSGLLTLFLYLYDNLSKSIPNFHDQLERMTGVPKSAFQRYDQETMKSNEKNKRAGLRKVLDSLVGNKINLVMR